MKKIVEVKETLEDGKLLQDMYNAELLIRYIIRRIEADNELNYDDYNYISTVFGRIRKALQKINEIISI